MSKEFLTFLHLSDIHFQNKIAGGKFDLDIDLRNELERDAQKLCRDLNVDVDAILITGVIAFAGKAEEYQIARDWLDQLCKKVNCDFSEKIYVVPGNHDVDQDIIAESRGILTRIIHDAA